MAIKFYKNINVLKRVWKQMFSENRTAPTMEFDFVKNWNKTLKQKKNIFLKGKLRYLTFFNENNIYAILPIIKNGNKCTSVYLLDYYDLLYTNIEQVVNIKKNMLQDLRYNGITLNLNNINENSNLYKIFRDEACVVEDAQCFAIKIESNNAYERFYEGLSKSARQNIRTAYNRLNADNKTIEFLDVEADSVKDNKRLYNKLYVNRRIHRYKNISKIKAIIYRINEPILNTLLKCSDFKLYSIKIDGRVAGYMSGLLQNKVFYVPRLVINDEFSRYSAGILLICEFIKNVKDVDYLDLATGSENYKKTLQAIEHKNYKLVL